jgi:iron complex outermembrane receptor protein
MQSSINLQRMLPLCAAMAALGLFAGAVHAQEAQASSDVLVQSGRLAQKQFDAPASVRVIDGESIRNAGAQVNLSEALAQAPGVVALNRNNYAQDVQISIRGFGSRAAFGLRGIRLITDGIPATTPDGQGQASTVSLTSAERIEVLTGPLAQLYGNSAGGVIQTFTREAGDQPQLDVSTTFGSYGLRRNDVQFSGRTGQVGIVADYSTFDIDGYRKNSAAQRKQFNGVLTTQLQEDTKLKLVANMFDMPLAQDPLGLKLSDLQLDPRRAGNNAELDRTRKSVQQNQLGAVLSHQFSSSLEMQWRLYGGTRSNLQYQARTFFNPSSWVDLKREYVGLGGQLKGKESNLKFGSMDWVLGFDLDQSSERRNGGETSSGEKIATLSTSKVYRDELSKARNTDAFMQMNWHWVDAAGHNPYTITSGLRYSNVQLDSVNYNPPSGDSGIGNLNSKAASPVLGVTWHTTDQLNLYANWGRGFETPTLAEAAYSVADSLNSVIPKFNQALTASKSQHSEIGAKWTPSSGQRLNASLFKISTENEIVTALSDSGKTAYVNAARTLRQGAELGWNSTWSEHWKSLFSIAWLDATYDSKIDTKKTSGGSSVADKSIAAGNRMPGIPQRQMYASLQWADQGFAPKALGFSASADWVSRSAMWASDMNDAVSRVAGYDLVNLRVRHRSQWGTVRLEAWAGVDNLMDRQYVGSVIVNQSANPPQYFEPGLPRNWMTGIKVSVPL